MSVLFTSIICFIVVRLKSDNDYPAIQSNADSWNPRIESLSDGGDDLFKQLFTDITADIDIEIVSTYSAWSESPLFVDSLNSILFSSPNNRSLFRYNLDTEETNVFISDAGTFGGTYDRSLPLDDCLECGPNGLIIGLNGFEDYVIMNQLALGRVIAFNPSDPDGTIIVIADEYNGKDFNSPNDITITSDGKSVYFTDPTFGLQAAGDTGFLNSLHRSIQGFQGIYKVDYDDIGNAELVINEDDMVGPNGIAVTNDGKYLIVSNTGDEGGWAPYWNVYKINKNKNNKPYKLYKYIGYDMGELSWNSWNVPVPLSDGMEIFNDDILLTVCPNGICLIDLNKFEIVGRLTIDHLISNIHIYNGYLYITGADNMFRIQLTAV